MNILLVKETRAGERRVGLVPSDVATLIGEGATIFFESGAGSAAGFADEEYIAAGAIVRSNDGESAASYKELFADIDVIVRAKRPSHEREVLENKSFAAGTIMVGALDPLEQNSVHIAGYRQAKIISYSIDQLVLARDDPMNILAQMSAIAGKMAVQDAVSKCLHAVKKAVIIGYGVVGRSAFLEARALGFRASVMLHNAENAEQIKSEGGEVCLTDRGSSLQEQQQTVLELVKDADIVITGARRPGEQAPVLIPLSTLNAMQPGSVVIDLALSEGGNVAGSEHDRANILGNEVIVANTSGYPKAKPHEASILWSRANMLFCRLLLSGSAIPLESLS